MVVPSVGNATSVMLLGVAGLELCCEPLGVPIWNMLASARSGEEGNEEDRATITTLTLRSTSSSEAFSLDSAAIVVSGDTSDETLWFTVVPDDTADGLFRRRRRLLRE